jgi:signal transduction histidine kinase/CheY-like chemotaxis protein
MSSFRSVSSPPIQEARSRDGRDLLAHPSPWRRALFGGLVVAGALPALPSLMVLVWAAAWFLVSAGEQRVARRRDYIAADASGLIVSVALAALSAFAAAALLEWGDPGARLFAVSLLCISCVNIVLRYYAKPRTLLAVLAPHATVLALLGWRLADGYLRAGETLRLMTPAATLGVLLLMLWPARNKLLEAWNSLVEARDLAERRGREAEQASRAKTAFLATFSHEIRTPLNGMLGMVQAIYADTTCIEQKRQLRAVQTSGASLLSVLDDVLDMSRIEVGQLSIEPVEVDMEHLVRGAVATFDSSAVRKGLAFAVSIDAAAKGVFLVDGLRIRQILHNLLSNAVKFTDCGGVAVSVSYAGAELTIEVADSGCGVPEDDREKVFERFVQLDSSTTRRAGGAGLGLAICRELCGLMGGSVGVTSREAGGSVFRAVLPVRKVGASRASQAVDDEASWVEGGPPIRILAADDNETNRAVLQALLSKAGVDLRIVCDGEAAVEAWRTEPWDVVLMDIQMPLRDGVEATREIRAIEAREGRPRTPIVALTANVLPSQQAAYREAGMDLVVAKPIDAPALFRAIEKAVEGALPQT